VSGHALSLAVELLVASCDVEEADVARAVGLHPCQYRRKAIDGLFTVAEAARVAVLLDAPPGWCIAASPLPRRAVVVTGPLTDEQERRAAELSPAIASAVARMQRLERVAAQVLAAAELTDDEQDELERTIERELALAAQLAEAAGACNCSTVGVDQPARTATDTASAAGGGGRTRSR
jgi:hypothetical protein